MKRSVFVLSFALLPLAGCPTTGGGGSQPERLELQPGYFDPDARRIPEAQVAQLSTSGKMSSSSESPACRFTGTGSGGLLLSSYASVLAVMLTAKRPSLIAFKLS